MMIDSTILMSCNNDDIANLSRKANLEVILEELDNLGERFMYEEWIYKEWIVIHGNL